MKAGARLITDLEEGRIDFIAPSIEPLLGLMNRYLNGWELFEVIVQPVPDKTIHIVDVGACVGSWGIPAAEYFTNSLVTCIEPYPANYECLVYNAKNLKNVRTINAAVSDKEGKINLSLPDISLLAEDHRPAELWKNYGLVTAYGEHDKEMVEVTAHKLDDMVEKVSLLKIDVEGMEMEVLAGAHRILTDDHPVLQIECVERNQTRAGHTIDEINELVLSYGYELFGSSTGDNYYVYGRNRR
jgi:FkbM family methyltransferase